MKITNEGQTFVFDSKTQEAIEAGQNRLTLLAVEELRLKKLKGSIESEVIKLEADIDYKQKMSVSLDEKLVEIKKDIDKAISDLEQKKTDYKIIAEDLNIRELSVQTRETAVYDKESEVNKKADIVIALTKQYEQANAIFDAKREALEEKIEKIDKLLKTL